MYKITVPATTANMGPGFDCIGMAFQMYNTLEIEEREKGLLIENRSGPGFDIPTDESNLIYQTIRHFYDETGKKLPGLRMIQRDTIPLTRGLGSSAACIVAGLLAANALSGAGLSREDLIDLAAHIEGHPDNSTPAFVGGMVIGAMTDKKLEYIRIDSLSAAGLGFAVMIPDFPLETKKARSVLPDMLSRQDAVFNASRTALLTAAMMSGDYDRLWTATEDRLHQPYRMKIIPGMESIFQKAGEYGAKAVFLSGAGPTLIAVTQHTDKEDDSFIRPMRAFLDTLPDNWSVQYIAPDLTGATVEYSARGSEIEHCDLSRYNTIQML